MVSFLFIFSIQSSLSSRVSQTKTKFSTFLSSDQ